MRRIKLVNQFHNTECNVIVKDDRLNRRQYSTARRKLCGIKDCCCRKVDGAIEEGEKIGFDYTYVGTGNVGYGFGGFETLEFY